MAAPVLKLTYFGLPARAFPVRFALRAAGLAFEDVRISFADLKGLKPSLPLGQLPVLEVDGVAMTQSIAMAKWAAKKAGLNGADDLEAFKIDELIAIIDEVWNKIPANEEAARLKWATEVVVPYFSLVERRITTSGGPFLLGSKLSVADLFLFALVDRLAVNFFDHMPKDFIKEYKVIYANFEAVKATEPFKAFGEQC